MSELDETTLERAESWGLEAGDTHTVAGRARIRAKLEADVEAFLQSGGKIEELDTGFQPKHGPRPVSDGFNHRFA